MRAPRPRVAQLRRKLKLPGDVLAKWGPWSQYHIGEVYEEQGNRDEARRAYRAALDYEEEFDYHKAQEQRARTALGRL